MIKKKKTRRMRGSRYHGYAAKKHKGKGNKGGKGMAGSGKKADHKKSYVLKHYHPYFGKRGYTSRRTAKVKVKILNVEELEKYKEGEVNLEDYKILSKGEVKGKYTIKAKAASKKAVEKVEKAGGKIIIKEKKKIVKEEKVKKLEKSEGK